MTVSLIRKVKCPAKTVGVSVSSPHKESSFDHNFFFKVDFYWTIISVYSILFIKKHLINQRGLNFR